MEREKFKSRLGFILISAGCAIGIGNVWRFPYIAGNNGGGIFVLFYLLFLIILGLPVMSMEFAIGRASRQSIVNAYITLEKPKTKWHIMGYLSMIGTYLLMMYYTTIAGWMLYYCYAMFTGKLANFDTNGVKAHFNQLTQSPGTMILFTFLVIIVGFLICSFGLQNGVEKITKPMMIALIVIMIILAINSLTLSGGTEGLSFYLYPDINKVTEVGLLNVIVQAMNQSFFTLSIGMGSMLIFGSYQDSNSSILGESSMIAVLDTFIALVSGLIIFPACFAYGVEPDSGPSLVFITLPNIFNEMPLGQLWGGLFFLFMTFAAFSTVIGVFEHLCALVTDIWKVSRKKSALINTLIMLAGALPCILGFNVLSGFQPLGKGSNILDLEDFIVSNLLLPIGSFIIVLFCTIKKGWGMENYYEEVNKGNGAKMPKFIAPYLKYILPIIILFVLLSGLL